MHITKDSDEYILINIRLKKAIRYTNKRNGCESSCKKTRCDGGEGSERDSECGVKWRKEYVRSDQNACVHTSTVLGVMVMD